MMPCSSAQDGFPTPRSSAEAPNLHVPPIRQNKNPIWKANHTDLHILEEILAMICSPQAKLIGALLSHPTVTL